MLRKSNGDGTASGRKSGGVDHVLDLHGNLDEHFCSLLSLGVQNLDLAAEKLAKKHRVGEAQTNPMILHLGELPSRDKFPKSLEQEWLPMLFDTNACVGDDGG